MVGILLFNREYIMSCCWFRRVFVVCFGGFNLLVLVWLGDYWDLVWVYDIDLMFLKSFDVICGGFYIYWRCWWCYVLLGVFYIRWRCMRGFYIGGFCIYRNLVVYV